MIKLLRLAIVIFVPALFWFATDWIPALITNENLRYLSGTALFCWSIAFIFFQRMGSVTNYEALPQKQLRLLEPRLRQISRRVWLMAFFSLLCAILIWVVTSDIGITNLHEKALFVGFLFGAILSFIVVLPFWFNELTDFQNQLKFKAAKKSQRDAVLKSMG